MKTFFVYPNIKKNGVRELLPKVCKTLQEQGAHVILPLQCRGTYEGDFSRITFLSEDAAIQDADAGIVLGGDGTILRIAKQAAAASLPILGVNFGHIGFMTEIECDELATLQKLIADDYVLDSRMMLHVCVLRDGKTVYETDALNDIVVSKGAALRIVCVRIDADGEPVTTFNGDGVIVSTPTGTTAYALSAGGPIVEPSAENIAVTPICAHALQAKSFVFDSKRRISLHAASLSGKTVYLSADGGTGFEVLPEDLITIEKSELKVQLLRIQGNSFYKILQKKL